MATKQAPTRQAITLKGSTVIVTDFFKFAVNTILYQRGVYPADDFHLVKKYGQVVMLTQDLALENYLDNANIKQMIEWLLTGSVTQLVLAIISKDSRTTLERWVFDVHLQNPPTSTDDPAPYVSLLWISNRLPLNMLAFECDCFCRASTKPESQIQAEIRDILKQIVSTVTFLPTMDEPTVFNILAYTSESADVPAGEWVDTDPLAIEASKSQQVRLRSFSTDVHRVEAMVAYRYEG
ncbi:spindle assembly checkpoint protein [Fomitiporia mediterranea MF3/22]|uniref:spindle assembly checkpoint protein n=1 Tax=Fomitiporia mediterranea (strain MF3/22) TaxID=694068 RepID=UPI0004407D7E|nr:spindle assembly checkpoint protein [Fomitiporia mediterranea MF3/22]EJD04003.1 spindle assembly checkpoint protein [Fomitiporia mediterranea MF3/22]